MDDFAELEIDNPEFLLALLDARAVAGDRVLLKGIAARVRTPAAHARILDELKRLIDDRHARYNDTFYQLEPDIKDAPGALRDLWAARTIAALTDPALIDRGPTDRARLDEAEEFLLRLRSILHAQHKRNQNVLNHESRNMPRADGYTASRAIRWSG
jgi:[protein-PII] uridylyltransferase